MHFKIIDFAIDRVLKQNRHIEDLSAMVEVADESLANFEKIKPEFRSIAVRREVTEI